MGLDVNRWLKYAKARLDAAVGSGNQKLDELEARREVERGERPWADDHDDVVPTLDQVRARIEWEAERQGVDAPPADRQGVPARPEPGSDTTTTEPDAPEDEAAEPAPTTSAVAESTTPTGAAPRSPEEQAEDAAREMARLELEARQRASAERLDAIRRELGVDAPPAPDAPDDDA